MNRPWIHTCARLPSSSLYIQAYRCPTHTCIDLFHLVCTHRSVSTPLSCARARVCVRLCLRGRVCLRVLRRVCLARQPCVRYMIYIHGNIYKYDSCATHARVCVSLPRPCIPTCPCARAIGMALPFVCGDAFSCPHSHGLTRTDGSVCIYNIYTHPAPCADLCTRVSSRRTCAAYGPRRVVCARARVCVGAPASAPTRASTLRRRRASRSRLAGVPVCVGLQREHQRMEHRASHGLVLGMCRFRPARAPRRTALGRSSTHARPLCAPRGGAADVCACGCSYAYKGVCGRIAHGYAHVLECHRAPSTSRPIDVQRTHA
jgi:hypothetical protein